MLQREESRGLLFGMPLSLIWGYLAIAVFMTGDGIELAFLSRYVVDLGFSPTQASFLFTIYGLLAALSSWSSGVLADIFGPRRIMRIGVIAWILFHVLFLLFGLGEKNYALMVLFYGIRGLAYPLFIYAFVVWVSHVAPRERQASAMGWYWTMYSIGIGFLGTYLPSFTIPHIGFMGTLWMAVVWVAVAGAMVMFLVKDWQRVNSSANTSLTGRFRELSRGVTILFDHRSILIAALVRIICNLPLFGFPVIMPLFFTSAEVNFTMEQWLRIWGALFIVTIFTNVIWGLIGDRIGWVFQMRWFGCAGCAIATLAFYYVPLTYGANFSMAILAAVALGIGVSAFVPMGAIFPSMAPEHKGAALSAHNLAAGLSSFMGPAIATLGISTVGVEGIVWIYALLYLLGVVLTYFIQVDQPGFEPTKAKLTAPFSHQSKTSEAL